MKRILAIATSLFLLTSAASNAQVNSPPNSGRAPPGEHAPGANRPARENRPANVPPRPARPAPGRPNQPQRPPSAGRPPAPRPPGAGRPHYARPLPPRGNQFRHRGRSYNRIRGPAFVWPRGWSYRRWSIGALFPSLFLGPAYFYNNYATLGLQAPPPGYAWVRFGPDLVLVNLSTRAIEDVVYGVFM
jgi:Ni/Co efflux regulator RcnB